MVGLLWLRIIMAPPSRPVLSLNSQPETTASLLSTSRAPVPWGESFPSKRQPTRLAVAPVRTIMAPAMLPLQPENLQFVRDRSPPGVTITPPVSPEVAVIVRPLMVLPVEPGRTSMAG